jgi:23S rRNA pseudouridine1911/1915/1917 synthase
MKNIVIEEDYASERLDKVAAQLCPEFSRSALEKLIVHGQITVNGQSAKTKYKLKVGDTISITTTQLDRSHDDIDIPIIYEDDDVVVLNKQAGVLTHSKGQFNKEGTVATWLQTHAKALGLHEPEFWLSERAGIVHRLDRATSGIIICAKTKETHVALQKQFSQRTVKKTYLAVIAGELPETVGIIDVPIQRNPKKPATFRVGVNGKSAQTAFQVENTITKNNKLYSLVELRPTTGRTHQLRVHMQYLHRPIMGDDFYDGETSERLMLHAQELEITLPGGKRRRFYVDPPQEFAEYAGE